MDSKEVSHFSPMSGVRMMQFLKKIDENSF